MDSLARRSRNASASAEVRHSTLWFPRDGSRSFVGVAPQARMYFLAADGSMPHSSASERTVTTLLSGMMALLSCPQNIVATTRPCNASPYPAAGAAYLFVPLLRCA